MCPVRKVNGNESMLPPVAILLQTGDNDVFFFSWWRENGIQLKKKPRKSDQALPGSILNGY